LKNCPEAQKKEILKAFKFIQERLASEDYRKELHVAMNVVGFCVTKSRAIGVAFTSGNTKFPCTIVNIRCFDRSVISFEEFAVTVLHELLHAFEDSSGENKVSIRKKKLFMT